MRSLAFVVVAVASTLASTTAFADEAAGVVESAPGVLHLAQRTIYGRPNRPMVIIEVKTPTAASAAGAAHETVRASLLERAEPASMRH